MADRKPLFTPTDRVAIGVTLMGLGVGAAVQGWPLTGGVIGWGLAMVIAEGIRLRPRQREVRRG